ncbi:CPBP family intramembrane glutamic endopeptidase [Candidatus Methylocalor cossyra]|uniref:CPBP family intramembrane glutamic endopeptidase n=1 Tax=Candidatus Methylocalor cossyra TaxID=3108543 RepID=UPI0032B28AD6
MAVLLVALLFRVLDIFVFRLDERWGEILLSKSLTLVLVLGAVLATGRDLQALGLRGTGMGPFLAVSIVGLIGIFGFALSLQILAIRLQGSDAKVSFEAVDPKTSLTGGIDFVLLLVLGNAINALAEEGLFRGLLQPELEARLGLWPAVTLQAVLFGLWHLVWPVKIVFVGQTTVAAAFSSGLALLMGSSVAGGAFGLLYHITQSLWVPIAVHFLNNCFYNFVHIRTDTGLDKNVLLMQTVATVGLVALVPLLRVVAR